MGTGTLADRTLLIVEDNEIIREGLATVLRGEGCNILLAAHGAEALDLLRNQPPPDLILLDMLLPVMDGWRFLEERKRDQAPAAVPFVIMTALSVASPEWAASLGAVGCLRKPVNPESLLAEVRRLLAPA